MDISDQQLRVLLDALDIKRGFIQMAQRGAESSERADELASELAEVEEAYYRFRRVLRRRARKRAPIVSLSTIQESE